MRSSAILLGLALLAGIPAIAGEAVPAATTAQPAPLLSEAENAALDAVITQAFASGFPDVRGSTLILGKLRISEPVTTEDNPQQTDLGFMGMEESTSEDGRRTRVMDGLHLRLADGRWLAGMNRILVADATHTVTMDPGCVEVPTGQLEQLLAARGPSVPVDEADEEGFIGVFVPGDRERLKRASAAARNFRGLEWSTAPHLTLAVLRRLQAIDTTPMMVSIAAADASPWMQMMGHSQQDQPLELGFGPWGAGHPLANFDYEAWMKEKAGTLHLAAVERGLANAFASWFQHLLINAEALKASGLSLRQAADGVLAMLPAEQRQERGVAIEGLIARQALPIKAPDGADLAGHLQSWLPDVNRGMFMSDGEVPEITAEMLANIPAEHRPRMQAMIDAAKAWKPTDADLPGLLALLDDPRPSRWLDGQTPRTVGDNALRALSTILRFDPRLLVGRKPTAAWTAAERTATANDLRAWWQRLGGKPLADGLAEAVPSLPPAAVAALLRASKPEARGPLLDRLATAWDATFPTTEAPMQIGTILGLAAGHAGLAAVVGKQPAQGELRPLLACWQDRAGRPAELDRLLGELSGQPPADDTAATRLAFIIAQAARNPSPARLQRIMTMAGGSLDDRRTWSVLAALSDHGRGGGEAWNAIRTLDGDGRRMGGDDDAQARPAQAIPLALAAICLADRRALPEGLAKVQLQDDWGEIELPGLQCWLRFNDGMRPAAPATVPKAEREPPVGLRVRDIAACVLGDALWQLGLNELAQEHHTLDLWKPADERDRAMQPLIEGIVSQARSALEAAKLPDVLPAELAAPAAGDKALF